MVDGWVELVEDLGVFFVGLLCKVGEMVGEGCLFVGEGGEVWEGVGMGVVGLGG